MNLPGPARQQSAGLAARKINISPDDPR